MTGSRIRLDGSTQINPGLNGRSSEVVKFLAWRFAVILPTLLGASLVVFLVMRLLPGDVVLVILSNSPHTVEVREALREELGLNDPLPVQYLRWLWRMVNGQFGGRSLENREPIGSLLSRQLPVTALLAGYAVVLSLLISIPLGILSALWNNRWPDYAIRIAVLGGLCIPSVWLALLVLLGLLVVFHWSPPIIYTGPLADFSNHVQMMVWPTLLLTWEYCSHLVRITRAGMIQALRKSHVATARSAGVPERIIVLKYALRDVLVPTVTVAGLQFGTLLGGALVLETIFGLPGVGRGLVHAALARDYPVIQSFATLLVLSCLLMNLIVDTLYGIIDPRIVQTESIDST